MQLRASLSVYLLLAISFAENTDTSSGIASTKTTNHENGSRIPATTLHKPTETKSANYTLKGFDSDGSMIQRALYVLIGFTIIGVLYFLIRAVRLKKTTIQRKKYGLLSNYDDTVQMAQLESDEDDMTVYEAKSLRR